MGNGIEIATGREKDCCICHMNFKSGDERVSLENGNFKGHTKYDRFHKKCFVKFILKRYEFMNDTKLLSEVMREILSEKL